MSDAIRTQQVADYASRTAVYPLVRAALLQQRVYSSSRRVADGRDMGTVVFPQAQIKVFRRFSTERAKDV